jgi:type I site-specific restriction endonuclease
MFLPKYLIGLSATPERMDKKSTVDFFGGESQLIGRLDLAWALANGWLAKPKYRLLTDDIDQTKLSEIKMGLTLSDIDKKIFIQKKDEEIIKIIEENIEKIGLKNPKGVVFCKSIEHMKNLIQYFPVGTATMIHSQMEQGSVSEKISSFREGKYRYILVRDIFNEGVDIPEINLIIFLRKTSSKTIWLQQLGRGLRKTDNKKFVDVFDFVGSVSRILEISELNKEIKDKVELAKNLKRQNAGDDEELNLEENLDLEENGIIHDDHLDVNYTNTSVEIQKLLEKMNLETKSKEDCLRDLDEISKKLDRIPSLFELTENLVYSTEIALKTLFDNYLDFLSKRYSALELEEIVKNIKIEIYNFAKLNYKNSSVILPAETILNNISENILPICSIHFVNHVLLELSNEVMKTEQIVHAQDKKYEEIQSASKSQEDLKEIILIKYKQSGKEFDPDSLTSKECNEILDNFLTFDIFKRNLEKK